MSIVTNLSQIAVFVRVVDSGSFTQAARLLKQPKSRVSRTIAALERDLGVSLLYRTTRQFSPTEEGRALYENAKGHIYALEGASEQLRGGTREVSGTLKLTTAEDLGTALLGGLLTEARALYPKLTVELDFTNEIVDLVRDGIDLAIRIGQLEDTTLKSRKLGTTHSVLVATPEFLKRHGTPKTPADLARFPACVFSPEAPDDRWRMRSRKAVAGAPRRDDSVPLQVICRSNSPRILLELALASQGIAFFPEYLCLDSIKRGGLKRVLETYASVPTPVHFVWPAQKESNPKVRAFVDLGVTRLSKYFAHD